MTDTPRRITRNARADSRIVYGIHCVWWGDIADVGLTPTTPEQPIAVPCCPHCGSMLMELPNIEAWWKGVDAHEAAGHPGYRQLIEWQKNKCFITMRVAKVVYENATKNKVQL